MNSKLKLLPFLNISHFLLPFILPFMVDIYMDMPINTVIQTQTNIDINTTQTQI